ncbi:MAG: 3-phosphoglycerate dehydrogenase family protein [Clostridia bacterium]|nr:3-phosphoglycerate dehydrogenase family protein [Clostridia bacterium]
MTKILKLNKISPLADRIFDGCEYGEKVENPDGIMVRSAAMADYNPGDALLAVARAGAGTNNIPCAEYAEKGIAVFNTPGANANAVKELVICELFLGGRKIVDAIEWAKTLKGCGDVSAAVEKGKGSFVGCEIYGKTLGVIGLGAIGIGVANAAAALGMNVLGADPFLSAERAVQLSSSIRLSTNEEILRSCDFITVHVPLTPETKAMFNEKTIARMKDGAVLINNSRGDLVDDKAIAGALKSGKLSRYITDFPTDALIGTENAICVPHLGASTPEAEDNCAVMAANELLAYIKSGNIVNSVNLPNLSTPRAGAARLCVIYKAAADMIAKITAAVPGECVNSASSSRGGYGYAVFDSDKKITDADLEMVASVPGVIRARAIN